jgi:hypothetical protein
MDRSFFRDPCLVKCGEGVSCTYNIYKVGRHVKARVFHTFGILASLFNVEREDGHPIEILALMGYHVRHGKPLHLEMSASLLAIESANHDV